MKHARAYAMYVLSDQISNPTSYTQNDMVKSPDLKLLLYYKRHISGRQKCVRWNHRQKCQPLNKSGFTFFVCSK